ncbi:MAG: PKD domain-containing protein [Candidatus Pacearchaeota archaeon]
MKKILILVITLFLLSINTIDCRKGDDNPANYHSICSIGNCYLIDGPGKYVCDPKNVGNPNPCCRRSYCSNGICVFENFERVGEIPYAGYTCPEQYECYNNIDCNPCQRNSVICNTPPNNCYQNIGNCIIINKNDYICNYNPLPSGTPCGPNQYFCNGNGNCICNPECTNKECGPDGCGGSCGTCVIGTCGNNQKCYSVFFSDMNFNKINTANLNDRIKLVISGNGQSNKIIEFKINKKSDSSDWPFPNNIVNSQTSSKSYTTVRMNEAGEYYFSATIQGETQWFSTKDNDDIYKYIAILPNELNSPPVAKIELPIHASIFSKNFDISFNQTSYDEDDFFDYCWNFDDSNITCGNSYDYINYNTTHQYSSVGQKNINLSVVDERGLKDSDTTSILVIDSSKPGTGIYVFANISKPSFMQEVSNPVTFDATGSYAIEVSTSPFLSAKCLGGGCPDNMNTPVGIINIDPNGRKNDYNYLTYTWEFFRFDGTSEGKSSVHGNKIYSKNLANLGLYSVRLTVNVTLNDKSSASTSFRVFGISPIGDGCEKSTGIWREGTTTFDTKEPNSKCLGPDGAAGTEDDCCPPSHICKETNPGSGTFKCEITDYCQKNNINTCSDYNTEEACKMDICGKGNQNAECGKFIVDICQGVSSSGIRPQDKCKCSWDAGECKQTGKIGITIEGIDINDISCSVTSTAGDCLDGVMHIIDSGGIDWSGVDLDPITNKLEELGKIGNHDPAEAKTWLINNCNLNSLCFQGARDIICGEETIKLEFFTFKNLITSVIIIGIIYFVGLKIKSRRKVIFKSLKII